MKIEYNSIGIVHTPFKDLDNIPNQPSEAEGTKGVVMVKQKKAVSQTGVDKGLVAMFLRMSPEERLRANDNALRTILELRHAYRQRRIDERKSRRNS